MSYQSKHLVALFKVSPETLRQWTLQFKEYLSLSANPGVNKQRFYTVEDVQVLGWIAQQKNAGFTFDEIHISLKNGSRIDPPNLDPEEIEEIVGNDEDTQLAVQVSQLQHKLTLAQEMIKQAEIRLQEMKNLQENNIKLTVQLETSKEYHSEEVSRLQAVIDQLNQQLQTLTGQAGKTYAEGFKEGWSQRGNANLSE